MKEAKQIRDEHGITANLLAARGRTSAARLAAGENALDVRHPQRLKHT
jgi:hypothetical protein